MFHSKPSQRASWAYHSVERWYIGPSVYHYRCLKIYIPLTRSEINSDTVTFISRYIPIPEANIDDHLRKTTNYIVNLLLIKTPAIPALQPESAKEALLKIAQLLNREKLRQ